MKQIQSSVRVNINEYVYAWSEFLFVSLLVIFNFFPQMNHFYYFTSLHGLQDVENHCAHLRDIELKTGRKIPYVLFPHVLFSILEIVFTRAAPAFDNLFMGCVFNINTVHKTVEKLTFQAFY